ncbi:MAG: ArsR/SmtB family transcription factor [Steroidobacteraceae bacterium]
MAEQTAQRQAPLLAALAQVTRLQILARVAETGVKGMAAGEIARSLRCPASTLSFHLKELSRTGVLAARPEGRYIHYALQRQALEDLARYIAGLAAGPSGSQGRRSAATRGSRRGRASDRTTRAGDRNQLSIFGD